MIRTTNSFDQIAQLLAQKLLEAGVEQASNSPGMPVGINSSNPQQITQGLHADRQQTRSMEHLIAQILQNQFLKIDVTPTLKEAPAPGTAGSTKPLNNTTPKANNEAERKQIEAGMRGYDPTSSSADETAVAVSKRKDLLPHLTADERTKLVQGLFDGSTSEEEEDAAMEILRSANDQDLKKIVDSIGWEKLKDELDPHDIDEISKRLANPKADSSNSPSSKTLEKAGVTDSTEEMKEINRKISQKLDSMPPAEVEKLANEVLTDKKAVLAEIASLERSGKGSQAQALRAVVDQLSKRTKGELKSSLEQYSHQIRYTSDISARLRSGDYSGLLEDMRQMADPSKSKEERTAIFETLRSLEPELRGMEETIKLYGNAKQKGDAEVFMSRYRTFMSTFDPNDSAATYLDKLAGKLGLAGQTMEDKLESLRAQTANTVGEISTTLRMDSIFDTLSDDQARELTNSLHSKDTNGRNHLANLPADYKAKLINKMLAGHTGDEEEQAILHILRETKKNNPTEFYQLISSVGYDALDSNIDGEENDEFQRLMRE